MPPISQTSEPIRAAPEGRHRWPVLVRVGPGLALAAAVGAGAALSPQGSWAVASLAALCAVAVSVRPRAEQAPAQVEAGQGPRVQTQANSLARQVVPVWRRNVDGARLHTEQSMSALTESFAAVSTHLDQALRVGDMAPKLSDESIDALMARHQPELDALLASTQRVAALKQHLTTGLGELSATLGDMATLSKEVQTISRATHLLALNASVEAQRASTGGHEHSGAGFAVVAKEVRLLADQSREAGVALGRRLVNLQDKLQGLQRHGRGLDTDDDELHLQAEQRARAVMRGLLQGIDEVGKSQRALHEAGLQVQGEVEQILVSLQSQDRLSQMLVSVTDDMTRLQAWLEGGQDDAAVSANRWLERLEASYTMEDMRASHHDTVKVDQTTEVEFF